MARGLARCSALVAITVAATALHSPPVPAAPRDEEGQFNVTCRWVRTAPDDPIVYPGLSGRSHLHVFFGNPYIDAYSTPASLRGAPQGRCHRGSDRSAYWIPAAYGRNPLLTGAPSTIGLPPQPPQGRVFLRPNFYAVAYYRTAGRRPASIQPFPPGLQMIAGDSSARGPQAGEVVSWRCVYRSTSEPYVDPRRIRRLRRALVRQRRALRALGRDATRLARRKLREIEAALRRARRGEHDGTSGCRQASLKLVIRFPDCWDGRRLDSPDHKSHMADARRERGSLRVCPRTHPVPVPKLTLNVRYEDIGPIDVALSSGAAFTAHADFMNGWDQAALAALVRRCLNANRFCGRG